MSWAQCGFTSLPASTTHTIADRGVTLTNFKINNNLTRNATVLAGSNVSLNFNYSVFQNGTYCPGCVIQIYIGIHGYSSDCIISTGGYCNCSNTYSTTFTAPSTPGKYRITLGGALNFVCSYDVNWPFADSNYTVAEIIVRSPTSELYNRLSTNQAYYDALGAPSILTATSTYSLCTDTAGMKYAWFKDGALVQATSSATYSANSVGLYSCSLVWPNLTDSIHSGYIYIPKGIKDFGDSISFRPDYTHVGFYDTSQYYLSTSWNTWATSKALAEAEGGHLATINSAGENDFLTLTTNFTALIGLNDIATEGTFEWVTGEPVTYTNWNAGEPNNAGDEDIVQLIYNSVWNDNAITYSIPHLAEISKSKNKPLQYEVVSSTLASGSSFKINIINSEPGISYRLVDLTLGSFSGNGVAGNNDTIQLVSDPITSATNFEIKANRANPALAAYLTGNFPVTIGTPATGLNFDGTNDYAYAASTQSYPTGDFTVEAWIKTTAIHGTAWSWGGNTVNNYAYLGVYFGKLRFSVGNGTMQYIDGTSIINDGSWHHIAVSKSNGIARIYVDGILENSAASTAIPSSITVNSIGAGLYNGLWDSYFNGTLDEVRVWTVAKNSAELVGYKNCELDGSETGLQFYAKFNNESTVANGVNTDVTSFTDNSTNSNTFTLSGFALSGTTSNWTSGYPSFSMVCSFPFLQVDNNSTAIFSGALTPSANDSTDFGQVQLGETRQVTYTLANYGDALLTIDSVTISGSTKFVAQLNSTALNVNQTTALKIAYNAQALGTDSALVTIYSTDINNPVFTFRVKATTVDLTQAYAGFGNAYLQNSNTSTQYGINNLDWISNTFTIEWWHYPVSNGDYNQVLASSNAWSAFVFHGSASGGIFCGTDINSRFTPTQLPNLMTLNTWQHFAFVYNNGIASFYKNGVLISTKSMSPSVSTWGGLIIGANNIQNFHGKMDELRIWQTARTQAQIEANLYQRISPTDPDLKAYYNFDQQSGSTTIADISGNGYPFTVLNANTTNISSSIDTLVLNTNERPIQNYALTQLPFYTQAGQVNFEILNFSNNPSPFTVNQTTGATIVTRPKDLNFDTNPNLYLTYSVSKPGINADTAVLKINLIDQPNYVIWTGNGNWQTDSTSNWNLGFTPESTDSVVVQNGNLQLDATATIKTLVLQGGTLTLSNGKTLIINGNLYLNGGTITPPGNSSFIEYSGNVYSNNALRLRNNSGTTVRLKAGLKLE